MVVYPTPFTRPPYLLRTRMCTHPFGGLFILRAPRHRLDRESAPPELIVSFVVSFVVSFRRIVPNLQRGSTL